MQIKSFLPACFTLLQLVALPAHALEITIINQYGAQDHSLRLLSSEPHAGQVLDVPPESIILQFTQGVRGDKSYIRVTDLYGSQMNDGPVETTGSSMRAALPPLAPGTYRVRWRARCQCSDQKDITDSFKFSVR
jgi:methionine-rich copper-binding protein CopC